MRVIGGISVILFALLTSFLSLEAQQTPGEILPVRQITLDNGMRLVILKRRGLPPLSFPVKFNVGGVNERLEPQVLPISLNICSSRVQPV